MRELFDEVYGQAPLDPEEAVRQSTRGPQRKRFYARAIPEKWRVLFTHDHHTPMGYVTLGDRNKPVIRSGS